MKNVKLNIRKLSRQGFSLVEMLVVIAVIGIIAAIAIPNIGNVNTAARDATARRNAQTLASTFSAAMAAGAPVTAYADVDAAITGLSDGVSPTTGPFVGQNFVVPNVPKVDTVERNEIKTYLELVGTSPNAVLNYKSGIGQSTTPVTPP